jgi:hypothetical protein
MNYICVLFNSNVLCCSREQKKHSIDKQTFNKININKILSLNTHTLDVISVFANIESPKYQQMLENSITIEQPN